MSGGVNERVQELLIIQLCTCLSHVCHHLMRHVFLYGVMRCVSLMRHAYLHKVMRCACYVEEKESLLQLRKWRHYSAAHCMQRGCCK
jgi:hypothetical protein